MAEAELLLGRDGASLDSKFVVQPDGIYFLEEDKSGEVTPVLVCSTLRILANTRNSDGKEWGFYLEVLDPEGQPHRWAMPARLLAGGSGYCSELMALGLRVIGNKGKQRLGEYLNLAITETSALCVDRIGWHGQSFVLLDEVYGDQAGELIVPQGILSENPFRQKGSLDEWKRNVGRYCVGNSRLVLGVSAALAAPLLEPLNEESGGLHLVGDSSIGKTTALRVAGSVCGGGPRGFIRPWRVTDNALEVLAASHCDSLLCLDEMGQAESHVVSKTAYMLANEHGKGRAKGDGQGRKSHTWRLLFLSTGEVTLSDKVAEDGRGRAKAGQSVRVVDIPADAGADLGLFEELHGYESADLFARDLKDASASYYGTPLRSFLQQLVMHRDHATKSARGIMSFFEMNNCPKDADGQVLRVCGRFALLAAAGEIATELGILPWPREEAFKAAATCFRAWLESRGGAVEQSGAKGLDKVRTFLRLNETTRFEDMDAKSPLPVSNLAGYRNRKNGVDEFLVSPKVFREEICSGLNVKPVCAELKMAGYLLSEPKRNTKTARTPGGRKKMYAISSAVLSGDSGDSGDTLEPLSLAPSPMEDPPSGDNGDTSASMPPVTETVPDV